ncbi:MAG: TldD/PmbA family protein [Pseudomonadota bacterium]
MSHAERFETRAQDLATRAVEAARKAGATAADAVVTFSTARAVTVRGGQTEEIEQADDIAITLRAFDGQRMALVATQESALDASAERAVAMARAAPEDPSIGLADESALATPPFADLDLYDPADPDVAALTERALGAEAAAMAVAGVTKSDSASASVASTTRALATSNGFCGATRTSGHSHGVTAIAGEGTRMERDGWYASRRHLADLEGVAGVGTLAGERAVRRIGGAPIPTTTAAVVFEPRAATGFIRHLLSAINGQAVSRNASFLAGKVGSAVFPSGITVRDDPHVPRGFASRPFDGEGLAAHPLDLVADGVLQHTLLDLATARKLGLQPNGRASRGAGNPSPGSTNVSVQGGAGDLAAIMAQLGSGFLVTDLIGMGANTVSGSYSRGAGGFWFENGEIVKPVNEVTIAGTLPDMFARAIFGDDAPGLYAVDAPTIAVEGMTIGGV